MNLQQKDILSSAAAGTESLYDAKPLNPLFVTNG
jgi:hypothetical protein